jgi:hypothetical protein
MGHLSEWNELVKKVRAETGKSLKDTLTYIKQNNLYKKKANTTTKAKAPKRGYLSWSKEEIKPKPQEEAKTEGAGKPRTKRTRKLKKEAAVEAFLSPNGLKLNYKAMLGRSQGQQEVFLLCVYPKGDQNE